VKRNWLLYLVIFSLALNFGTIGTFVYLRYQDKTATLSPDAPAPLAIRALWRTLNLDGSQRRTLHNLLPEHRGKVAEIRGVLAQKRQELFELLQAEPPEAAAIHAKVREISDLQGKLEEELVRFLLEFKKHLKPEQNAAFLALVRTRLDKALGDLCGPRRGRGPGRGPGLGPPPGRGPGHEMGPPPGMGPGPRGPGRPD